MHGNDELDVPEAALWLLVWQEPTDRALAGWCPTPSVDRFLPPGECRFRWWRMLVSEEPDAF
jgi:hypothetical protein